MSFKDLFIMLSKEKSKTLGGKIGSIPSYDQIIKIDMYNIIRSKISNPDLIVKPSVGQTNYADIPWICIRSKNTRISPNTQKGIYLVMLFNKSCTEFYLCLSQGYTYFEKMDMLKEKKEEIINKMVEYFQTELKETLIDKYNFSKEKIDLGENVSNLGKGYIKVTIISKKYSINDFDELDFFNSLEALIYEYEEIITHIGSKSYDDIVSLIYPDDNMEELDKAIEEIQNVLDDEIIESRETKRFPIRVEKGDEVPQRFSKISQPKIFRKTDYIKQAKEQYQIGLMGEKLALELERNRLSELGLDPDEHIRWRSIQSDSYGYDFESVDLRDGKLIKIFIEVKATKDIKDTFFYVTKNEVQVSKEKKDAYRLFRIFDITSITPKYYFADGEIEDNFYLDPVTYCARYKYSIVD